MPSDPVEQLRKIVKGDKRVTVRNADLLAELDRLKRIAENYWSASKLVSSYDSGGNAFADGVPKESQPEPAFDGGEWGRWKSWMNGWDHACEIDRLRKIEAAAKASVIAYFDCSDSHDTAMAELRKLVS